jgi:hypothetical protein
MKNKKIIFGITLITYAMISAASPAGSPIVPRKTAERADDIGSPPIKQNLLLAAENEQTVAESKDQATADKNERAPGSGSENKESSSKNSADTAAKPLKPFVPSEKIAAEQAVDFPADI